MDTFSSICTICASILITIGLANSATLEITPNQNLDLGKAINLTCTFSVDKTAFQDLEFKIKDKSIFLFNTSTSGDRDGILAYGHFLADSSEKDSLGWVSLGASYCLDAAKELPVICEVTATDGTKDVSDEATVTFKDPVRTITIDGEEVCEDGSDKHTVLAKNILDKVANIQFSTMNEMADVNSLTFQIEDKLFKPMAQEDTDKWCAHGAYVGGVYKFTKTEDYSIKYDINGGQSTGSCTLTIFDDSITTAPPVTTDPTNTNGTASGSTGKWEPMKLYGSTLALIIVLIGLFLLGIVGLWHVYLAKHGRAAPPPLTATKGIEY